MSQSSSVSHTRSFRTGSHDEAQHDAIRRERVSKERGGFDAAGTSISIGRYGRPTIHGVILERAVHKYAVSK